MAVSVRGVNFVDQALTAPQQARASFSSACPVVGYIPGNGGGVVALFGVTAPFFRLSEWSRCGGENCTILTKSTKKAPFDD